ncbi:CENP-B protein [Tricholoma matsutake]|nr:CENP-B protein [Tricholoma matsutake 945]
MNKLTSQVKENKKHLTYAFTTNADGSEKLPPLVMGKAARPCAFQKKTGAQLGFYYQNNAKAWMTTPQYQEWICDWDVKLRQQGHHVLWLQDNFSAHSPSDDLTNIHVENFTPNLTSHVQPNDAGVINRYDNNISPALICKINQL